MAQKVEVKLIDDLDGGPADEVVSFALDGVMYEIDLSTANAKQFREAFAHYLDVSRKVKSARKAVRRVPVRKPAEGPTTAAVREWARAEGFTVPDRGRISSSLMVKFQEAHA
jgi:hypothetical protein